MGGSCSSKSSVSGSPSVGSRVHSKPRNFIFVQLDLRQAFIATARNAKRDPETVNQKMSSN